MARTESTMLELGTPAPNFQLPDVVSGKTIALRDFEGKKALLVMFLSRHCPYVQHIKRGLASLAGDYRGKPVAMVAISSNYVADYPADAPSSLKEMAAELDFDFPFCYDESQAVAKAYRAACTPDFFLFDHGRRLAYRGQLDSSRPGTSTPVTGRDLRAAIAALLAGRQVDPVQQPSLGCNIKWRSS